MKIVVNQERMERLVTVGELLDMQSGNLPVIVSIMSKFVIGENGYLTAEKGLEAIRKLTITELKEAASNFSSKLTETAVPPPNALDSVEPSSQEPQQPLTG